MYSSPVLDGLAEANLSRREGERERKREREREMCVCWCAGICVRKLVCVEIDFLVSSGVWL